MKKTDRLFDEQNKPKPAPGPTNPEPPDPTPPICP